MKAQKGLMLIEPVFLMGLLTSFNMTNTALGSIMIGLSLLALFCENLRRVQAS